jgi:hypothetical protein
MHRVIKGHVDAFQADYGLEYQDDKALEAFVNYCLFRRVSSAAVNPGDLVYEGDDPGIDGVMCFIDEEHVSSVDEVKATMQPRKRDYEVEIVFTQSKTPESWDKKEINTFESAVLDFLQEKQSYPQSDFLSERKKTFDEIIKSVRLIKGGKPNVTLVFATTARKPTDREILAAFNSLQKRITEKGLFANVEVMPLYESTLLDLWLKARGAVETTFAAVASAPFPNTPGVTAGYVATVRAKEFIKKVLCDDEDRKRQGVFDKNVRDFLGVDNEVNAEILGTLASSDKQKRFGILNNGVTIIAPEVKVQGTDFYIRDFQIVNGCQTSSVLYEARDSVSDDVSLMVKIISTSDESIVDDIVRSTNRQTRVPDKQFLATLETVKAIERYFDARGETEEYRLFFERRENQFADRRPKAMRVFDIEQLARCVGAMFFDRPDLASRYPNKLTSEMRDIVFRRSNFEEIYYTATFAYYRLGLLLGNQQLEAGFNKLRWHILMAIKYHLAEGASVAVTSKKIKGLCNKIDEFMKDSSGQTVHELKEMAATIADPAKITLDELRLQPFVREVIEKVIKFRPTTKGKAPTAARKRHLSLGSKHKANRTKQGTSRTTVKRKNSIKRKGTRK